MNWSLARKKLLKLATGRSALRPDFYPARELEELETPPVDDGRGGVRPTPNGVPARRPAGIDRLGAVRASSLCVASGKGGTGKSVVAASLATLFSSRGRTLIVDADMGVGNAHIMQDVAPPTSFVEVVEGSRTVRDVLVECGGQVDLLGAGSGVPRMADLTNYEMHLIATGLEELELDYRYTIVDSAAGISRQTLNFAKACDATVIVTTPDLTAMTDAYAFLKVLFGRKPEARPVLIVNRAADESEAEEVIDRIARVCKQFIGRGPVPIGWLPEDPVVQRCVNRRTPVVSGEPQSPVAYALRRMAVNLIEELGRHHADGLGRSLLREVGYSAKLS